MKRSKTNIETTIKFYLIVAALLALAGWAMERWG